MVNSDDNSTRREQHVSCENFNSNFERIFGSEEDRVKNKEKGYRKTYSSSAPVSKSAAVFKQLEPFVSSVDGSVISDRGALRRHNKRNGVTDPRDYGPEYFKRKGHDIQRQSEGDTRRDTQERKHLINDALRKAGL